MRAFLIRLLTLILRLLAWPWAVRSLGAWPRATRINGSPQTAADVARPLAGGAGMGCDTANSAGRQFVALLHRDIPGDWDWAGPLLAALVLVSLRVWGQG